MQSLLERVEAKWSQLRKSQRVVAQFLLDNRASVIFSTASQLAHEAGTSDATVVRTARALGYSGLPELKRQVGIELTRTVAPSERLEETISRASDWEDGPVMSVIEDAEGTHSLMKEAVGVKEVTDAARLLIGAREVVAWGLGASGVAARYAADRFGRVGTPTRHLDKNGFQLANDLVNVKNDCCLLIFAPGRRHSDLSLLLHAAQVVGVNSVLVTNSHGPEVRGKATAVIDLPYSTTKLTSEVLSEILLVDILATTILTLDSESARDARRQLTEYRNYLEEVD